MVGRGIWTWAVGFVGFVVGVEVAEVFWSFWVFLFRPGLKIPDGFSNKA